MPFPCARAMTSFVTVSVLAGGLYVDELADDDLVLELLGRHLVSLGLEDGVLFEVLDVVGRAAALVLGVQTAYGSR